jgi:hypothetical protein
MRTANLKALQPLLLSLALIAATPLAPVKAQQKPADGLNDAPAQGNPTRATEAKGVATLPINAEPSPQEGRLNELKSRVDNLEQRLKANDELGPLGISWPFWLGGGSCLIGLIAMVLAIRAHIRLDKQVEEVRKLMRKSESLQKRIGGVELQMEVDLVADRNVAKPEPAPKLTPAQPQPSQTIAWPAVLAEPQPAPPPKLTPSQPQPYQSITWPAPPPDPQTGPAPCPAPISYVDLINALNLGDRQTLREAATAELNITSESENALAMGRAITTELEEVPGGGSYWLVSLQGQDWLFPTDRTLKGFAAAQPAKGLFQYEQQTIAQPQLIEPALLENGGTRWRVQTMGRIATP